MTPAARADVTTAASLAASPARRRRAIVLILISAGLWSGAGLFTRAIAVDLPTMQFWRALSGAAFMLVYLRLVEKRSLGAFRTLDRASFVVVVLSAFSQWAYIAALKLAPVADVMIVYATSPFVTAGVAALWLHEAFARRTVAASTIALAGIATMVAGTATSGHFAGQAMSFAMVATFAFVVVLARRRGTLSMVPVNVLAALLSAAGCAMVVSPFTVGPADLALLTLFGLTTLGLPLALMMTGARDLGAAEVALISMLDVGLGPLWVWLIYNETPDTAALVGGAIVIGAVLWYLAGDMRRQKDGARGIAQG